jgi:hypothetical protein
MQAKILLIVATILAGCHVLQASALGTLTFVVPDGVIGPTSSAPVELLLTLASNSVPLITNSMSQLTSGFTSADVNSGNELPNLPGGIDLATDTLSGYVSTGIGCPGGPPVVDTFVDQSLCTTGPPYNVQFATSPETIAFTPNLNIQPSTPFQFLFVTFVPSSGPVAPGAYTFNAASVVIGVLDDTVLTNNHPTLIAVIPVASTIQSDAGDFTRTVDATPEPGSFLLLAGGLA